MNHRMVTLLALQLCLCQLVHGMVNNTTAQSDGIDQQKTIVLQNSTPAHAALAADRAAKIAILTQTTERNEYPISQPSMRIDNVIKEESKCTCLLQTLKELCWICCYCPVMCCTCGYGCADDGALP